MIAPVDNIMAITPQLRRRILYGSLIYMGLMILINAQLQVSVKHAQHYDMRWIIAGAACGLVGAFAALAEKVHDCSRRQLLPI